MVSLVGNKKTDMKTAIVTGATGNLGVAIINKFIGDEFRVVGTLIANDAAQQPTGRLERVVVDLTNEEESAKFISDVIAKYSSIDVAVLTVGGFAMGPVVDTKTSDIAKQYRLNFETAYNVARPIFAQMLKQNSGKIFFVGSKPGLDAGHSKGMVAYGLAKSLIFRLAELMNDEAKGTNVVISVIVPGTIDTQQNRKAMPESDPENWVKPESIADIIYFYSSDAASVIREPVIKVYNNS